MSLNVRPAAIAGLMLLAALGACRDKQSDTEKLDRALIDGAENAQSADADPALTAALADQIMVDPALVTQANGHSVRTPDGPVQAQIPPTEPTAAPSTQKGMLRAPPPRPVSAAGEMTLGQLAHLQATKPGTATAPTCDQGFQYSSRWADRLPPEFPIYPGAEVSEAAGSDQAGCGLRIVSFTSGASMADLIDYYYTRAVRAGYATEHQLSDGDHILAGDRASGAFYLTATPRAGGGVDVDMVARAQK